MIQSNFGNVAAWLCIMTDSGMTDAEAVLQKCRLSDPRPERSSLKFAPNPRSSAGIGFADKLLTMQVHCAFAASRCLRSMKLPLLRRGVFPTRAHSAAASQLLWDQSLRVEEEQKHDDIETNKQMILPNVMQGYCGIASGSAWG